MDNLIDSIRIWRGSSEGRISCDGTTHFSAPVNMGYGHSVLFLVKYSSNAGIKGTTGARFWLQGSSSTGGTFVSYTTGSGAYTCRTTTPIPDLDNQLLAIDVVKPLMTSSHKFLRLQWQASTGEIDAIIPIQYGLYNAGTSANYASSYIAGTTRLLFVSSST